MLGLNFLSHIMLDVLSLELDMQFNDPWLDRESLTLCYGAVFAKDPKV